MIIFETERLYARPWLASDEEFVVEMYTDPEVSRYIGRTPNATFTEAEIRQSFPTRLAKQKEWTQSVGKWPIIRKLDHQPLGMIIFAPVPDGDGVQTGDIEIGWHLHRSAWGNGYATEAAAEALRRGFLYNLNLSKVVSICYKENVASERVMQRLGLTLKGTTSKYYGIENVTLYEITREEHEAYLNRNV
jgi:RimJ/RimL family protein N-acetyltransferase